MREAEIQLKEDKQVGLESKYGGAYGDRSLVNVLEVWFQDPVKYLH